MSEKSLQDAVERTEAGGYPHQAYAVVGSEDKPPTWSLLHHNRLIGRALQGKAGVEHTVDWALVESCVNRLAIVNRASLRLAPEEIIEAARHLAGHYRKARKPLPDVIAGLV